MWHAKALHTSSVFLPADCPLVSHVMSSYVKHHLGPKLEERKLLQESMVTGSTSIPSKGSHHTAVINLKEDDSEVPDERSKTDSNKVHKLSKAHKIDDLRFGNTQKMKNTKKSKKSLNISVEKGSQKRKKKPLNYVEHKSHKGTPKKFIDFTAYLNNKKKNPTSSSLSKPNQK